MFLISYVSLFEAIYIFKRCNKNMSVKSTRQWGRGDVGISWCCCRNLFY